VSTTGSTWQVLHGSALSLSAAKDQITTKVAGQSYLLLKAATKFASKAIPTIKLNAPRTDYVLDYLLEISATASGDGYNQVNFQMREKGKSWVNIGTSDRRTVKSGVAAANLYRVFIEPLKFAKGTELEFVAIMKTASGKTVTSQIVKAKI